VEQAVVTVLVFVLPNKMTRSLIQARLIQPLQALFNETLVNPDDRELVAKAIADCLSRMNVENGKVPCWPSSPGEIYEQLPRNVQELWDGLLMTTYINSLGQMTRRSWEKLLNCLAGLGSDLKFFKQPAVEKFENLPKYLSLSQLEQSNSGVICVAVRIGDLDRVEKMLSQSAVTVHCTECVIPGTTRKKR
jgi:hypothetical protein